MSIQARYKTNMFLLHRIQNKKLLCKRLNCCLNNLSLDSRVTSKEKDEFRVRQEKLIKKLVMLKEMEIRTTARILMMEEAK